MFLMGLYLADLRLALPDTARELQARFAMLAR
jgi:hypothetical protein